MGLREEGVQRCETSTAGCSRDLLVVREKCFNTLLGFVRSERELLGHFEGVEGLPAVASQ